MSERAPERPPRPCLPVAFWALVAVLGVERAALAADLDQASLLGPAALLLVAGVALGCAGARARAIWAASAAVVLVAAAAALGAERPPTIFVIKGGEVKASKVGLMNPREMAAFFEKA